MGSRGSEHENSLNLPETFPGGTSAEEIRTWAKQQVDAIETYLHALRPEEAEAVESLRDQARRTIDKRISDLASYRTLADDLGEGI